MILSIPPRNNFNQDYMAYWDGFLTEEDINLLLAQPEWINSNKGKVNDNNGSGVLDLSVRDVKVSWIYDTPEIKHIWTKMSNVVAEVNKRFFNFDLTGFYEPMQVCIYTSDNNHYEWHIDNLREVSQPPRKLSMALLLSDPGDFEGGEFQVKTNSDNPITLETKRGRAWFFPSYMLHRVTPVTKGIRRSLVLWVGGPPFK